MVDKINVFDLHYLMILLYDNYLLLVPIPLF